MPNGEVIPVASIVSASLRTNAKVPPLAAGCLLAFVLLLAITSGVGGCVALTEGSSAGVALIVLGIACVALMFIIAKVTDRKSHFVIVNTPAGKVSSASSRDEGSMRDAVAAINDAVIANAQ